MSTRNTDPMPQFIDADLQALANEIAANTGVSAATALQLAAAQRSALRRFASQWDAAVRRARAAARTARETGNAAELSDD